VPFSSSVSGFYFDLALVCFGRYFFPYYCVARAFSSSLDEVSSERAEWLLSFAVVAESYVSVLECSYYLYVWMRLNTARPRAVRVPFACGCWCWRCMVSLITRATCICCVSLPLRHRCMCGLSQSSGRVSERDRPIYLSIVYSYSYRN